MAGVGEGETVVMEVIVEKDRKSPRTNSSTKKKPVSEIFRWRC